MVARFFGISAGAPRPIGRREGGTTWDFVLFAIRCAHGEKSGPEVFRDLFQPGPETRVITIGVLRATHAREMDRCLSALRSFQKLLTSAGSDRPGMEFEQFVHSYNSYIRVAHQSRN